MRGFFQPVIFVRIFAPLSFVLRTGSQNQSEKHGPFVILAVVLCVGRAEISASFDCDGVGGLANRQTH